MSTPFLDRLGTSTLRLSSCFAVAAILTALGSVHPVGGELVGSATAFLGGAVFALAVASWQINASDRVRTAAMRSYWRAFSSNAVICLSTRMPNAELEDELSPLTPYHDALAGQKIQSYLLQTYGNEVPIVSVADLDSLQSVQQNHIILIGGPNLNHLTEELMNRVWISYKDQYFHWSSTFSALPLTSSLVSYEHDHLLKLQFVGGKPQVDDLIQDLHDSEGRLVEARGMCLRLEGLMGRGRLVLVFAGVDHACGTLAAVNFMLNPANVIPLASGNTQVIVSTHLNDRTLDSPESLRTTTASV